MNTEREELADLRRQVDELRHRLDEPEEIIRAIREGEVDSFVVTAQTGEQIYSLRSADALFRGMVEEMREGAVALDSAGLVLYCNKYFANMVSADRASMVGTSIFPLVTEESRSYFDMLRAEGNGNIASRREIDLCARDGRAVPVRITMNRIPIEGGEEVFCLIVTDLTLERRREQLLTESRRKDEFLAMLAHELRNPMASISAAVDALTLGGLGEEKVRWTLRMMARQVTQLTRLIDDLLDVSRITRGQIRLEMRPLDLAAAVSRGVETATAEITAHKHELRISLPGDRVRVLGDEARIAQVVSNLLHNAAKFTPDGGHIWVGVEAKGAEALVSVKDDGIGIDPEMSESIFDMFTQVDTSLKRAQSGLGLGLSLVRNLVFMHRGRVAVHSEGPGTGSEFVIALPLLAEQTKQTPATAAQSDAASNVEASRRILIVDDNIDAGEMLGLLLRRLGHQVQLATLGRQAAPAIRAFQPDVVLLDIGLPDVSGYEVAEELSKLPERKSFQLIALTGYGQEQDRLKSREAGFDSHWVKPLELKGLKKFFADTYAERKRGRPGTGRA
jgi:PAS domain S-box-containing protein